MRYDITTVTDPEAREEIRDLDARYSKAKVHLRSAMAIIKQLSEDYGLTYGEDDDDAFQSIKVGLNRLSADHEYMIEFVYAVNDIPSATAGGTTNSKGENQ